MSAIAIIFMIISILTIWGGLALALVNLSRHPEDPQDPEDDLLEGPMTI